MRHTPWGAAQHARVIAEGITLYSTASHGGIGLSPSRVAAMPEGLRLIPTWAGGQWYEEDCDVNIVILAFPEHFRDSQILAAVESGNAIYDGKPSMPLVRAWLRTAAARDLVHRAALHEASSLHKFRAGCSMGSGDGWRVSAVNIAGTVRIMAEFPQEACKLSGEVGYYHLPAEFTEQDVAAHGGRVTNKEEICA